MRSSQIFLLTGALLGASGVALGAWGAHGLSNYLGHTNTGAWDTAVLYQLIHALTLILIALLLETAGPVTAGTVKGLLVTCGVMFSLGVVFFCGSLYSLTLGGPRWLGPVTPIGGIAFIFGWMLLAFAAWRWR